MITKDDKDVRLVPVLDTGGRCDDPLAVKESSTAKYVRGGVGCREPRQPGVLLQDTRYIAIY